MSQFLLSGPDVLARHPGFKLIGRKEEFNDLCCIMTQSTAKSVIATGPGGVGISAIALNLQACKSDPDAPFDIVSKRLYWLDTDSLFALGDNVSIDKEFKSILGILSRTPESVLIIEDTIDLIEALRNCNMMHVINGLNSLVKANKTQAFLEVREKDLGAIFAAHSDFREHYTLYDLKEPVDDELKEIVGALAKNLEKSYNVRIDDNAVKMAITLSNRYQSLDTGLNCAQPERSRLLLDRSMSKYALEAHSTVPMVSQLEAQLAAAPAQSDVIAQQIETQKDGFKRKQARIMELFVAQRTGERKIVSLMEDVEKLVAKEKQDGEANKGNPKKFNMDDYSLFEEATGYATPEIDKKREDIAELEKGVAENKAKYDALTAEINASLCLIDDHVISIFSRISGIAEPKLRQNDTARLINLGNVMKHRVFGQDDVLEYIFRRVKIWRRGRRTNKPLPFMLCGPSGVGKTEICRALAEGMFDTDLALNKFDMGDFGEKNDINKLIGAPPGYEGFDVGGQMTNSIRSNPYQVMLQDEIEKAHTDIFNTYLGVLDNGYCKDNIGRRCEFGDAIMPFTTNIGQAAMLSVGADGITEEEAYDQTMKELEKFFKPEFLNRFEGRENIIILRSLGLDSIQRIATRELNNINAYYAPRITAQFSEQQLNDFCLKSYTPKIGARGIPGKIKAIEGFIVDKQLENADFAGVMEVAFDDQAMALRGVWNS